MKLVVFILNREEVLEQVLEAFIEAGVPGATVLGSEGMGRMLTSEVPLFADFQDSMKGIKPSNRVIFSVVGADATVRRLEKLLEKACGSLSVPGNGLLFTVPVDYAKGIRTGEGEA
jgi:nitrogen regulatory protein P-II 1